MADSLTTLADMAKINDRNAVDLGISEVFNQAPLLSRLNALESSNGNSHSYEKYKTAPVVGFRQPNTGIDHGKSEDELVTLALQILDASFHKDTAVADIARMGVPAYMAREARRHLGAAFKKAELQILYGTGTGGDAGGYVGLLQSYNALSVALGGKNKVIVPGTAGSGANNRTSVWAIRTTSMGDGMSVVLGDGNISILPYFRQFVTEQGQGAGVVKKFAAYMQQIQGWLGLQISTLHSASRLCNLAISDGALTDNDIAKLLKTFPEEEPATHLVMNGDAQELLRASRTATHPQGNPAPFPESAFNVPIVITSSVLNTEAVVT